MKSKTDSLFNTSYAVEKQEEDGYTYYTIASQRILIMEAGIFNKEYASKNKKESYDVKLVNTGNNDVKITIVRVSECPNDPEEYKDKDGKSIPTVTVLVDWIETFTSPPGELSGLQGIQSQVDNHFLINPDPNNQPGDPITKSAKVVKVHNSDLKEFDEEDIEFYGKEAVSQSKDLLKMPIVAVMDTGLKYKWEKNGGIERTLNSASGHGLSEFKIAKVNAGDCMPNPSFGYCGITEYLKNAKTNSLLTKMRDFGEEKILASPYDDNVVDEKLNDSQGTINKKVGRHGTVISAIVNHQGSQVLPVKVFDAGGWGTLFDVLCGCNYLLSCKRNGTDIKVLNASFSGSLNQQGRELLYRKMKALSDQGIWIIAAAGNDDFDLDILANRRYPAQFGMSTITGNSTSGIERVITINSAYKNVSQAGNFGSPVSIKVQSEIDGGFPSALSMTGGKPLEGTSFAAPYAAAVLAGAPDSVNTKAKAIEYLKSNSIPGIVKFVDP